MCNLNLINDWSDLCFIHFVKHTSQVQCKHQMESERLGCSKKGNTGFKKSQQWVVLLAEQMHFILRLFRSVDRKRQCGTLSDFSFQDAEGCVSFTKTAPLLFRPRNLTSRGWQGKTKLNHLQSHSTLRCITGIVKNSQSSAFCPAVRFPESGILQMSVYYSCDTKNHYCPVLRNKAEKRAPNSWLLRKRGWKCAQQTNAHTSTVSICRF